VRAAEEEEEKEEKPFKSDLRRAARGFYHA